MRGVCALLLAVAPAAGLHAAARAAHASGRRPHLRLCAAPPTASDWSFIDAAYLITCDEDDGSNPRLGQARPDSPSARAVTPSSPHPRPPRHLTPRACTLTQALSTLGDIGLRDRVEVRTFARDDGDRIRGCYTSHIAVLQEAAERLADSPSANVLVLEDNLALSPNLSGDVLRAVQLFCEGSADGANRRDMVHLAYIMYVPGLSVARTHADNIVQLKCNADSVRIRRMNSANLPNDQREFAE